MSISDNYIPVKQLGNGVTDVFSASWQILSESFIQVFLENVSTGVQVLQTNPAEYSVTFDSSGFVVTFVTPPPSTEYVVIGREVALDQSVPYTTSSGFQGKVIEGSYDKLTAITQDIQDAISRSITFQLGSSSTTTLPEPSPDRILGWNSSGNNLENKTNNGSSNLVTATGGTAEITLADRFGFELNVKDFGADNTNSETQQLADIQEAIDYGSVNKVPILIDDLYTVDNYVILKDDLDLIFQGDGEIKLKAATSTTSGALLTNVSTGATSYPASNIRVYNTRLDCNNNVGENGIGVARQCSDISFLGTTTISNAVGDVSTGGGAAIQMERGIDRGYVQHLRAFDCYKGFSCQGADEAFVDANTHHARLITVDTIDCEGVDIPFFAAGVDDTLNTSFDNMSVIVDKIIFKNAGGTDVIDNSANGGGAPIMFGQASNVHINTIVGYNETTYSKTYNTGAGGKIGAMTWGWGYNIKIGSYVFKGDVEWVGKIERARMGLEYGDSNGDIFDIDLLDWNLKLIGSTDHLLETQPLGTGSANTQNIDGGLIRFECSQNVTATLMDNNITSFDHPMIHARNMTDSKEVIGKPSDIGSVSTFSGFDSDVNLQGQSLSVETLALNNGTVLTYTPVITGASTAGTNAYTTQVGRYWKLDSLVTGHVDIQLDGTGGALDSTGQLRISLPIAASSTSDGLTTQIFAGGLALSAVSEVIGSTSGTNTYMNLFNTTTAGASSPLLDTEATDSLRLRLWFTYEV